MQRRLVRFYYPGHEFPAVSVTGDECALSCKHCNKHYLKSMVDARTPEALERFAGDTKGITGFLLSGGCDSEGLVDFEGYYPVLKRITESGLIVNAHVRVTDPQKARKLAESGVQIVSVDVVGDPAVFKEVYGIEGADPHDTLLALKDSGIPSIVPHVCIGLWGGKLSHEMAALQIIKDALEPAAIVFISLIPTKSTKYANVLAPKSEDILQVITEARRMFPQTPLLLGCMRAKGDRTIEKKALEAGIDGIVLPAREAVAWAKKQGWDVKEHKNCCALAGLVTSL